MVGGSQLRLEEVLNEKQICHVVKAAGGGELVRYETMPACEGRKGHLGDHFRAVLHVKTPSGAVEPLRLFLKCMPRRNQHKAAMIDGGNFYRREMRMFQLFEELGGADEPNPWRAKAYVYTEDILVMPDLSYEGYSHPHQYETLDLSQVLVAAASVGRFHAAYINYAANRAVNGRCYNFLIENDQIMIDPMFKDTPWLRAAAKLSANLLKKYSSELSHEIPDLEHKLTDTYIVACLTLKEYQDTLNVVLHRDLWINNIMFQYDKSGEPIKALLIDYQCLRYGPPAFDLLIFLYLTTSRSFRVKYEREIFLHYYSVFMTSLEENGRKLAEGFHYDFDNFLYWCERARSFALVHAIGIFPYVLMEPVDSQKHFDDPETFQKYFGEDRTAPAVAFCEKAHYYRDRQLEVTEEFVERYVLKQL